MDVWLDFVPNHTAIDNAWVTEHPEYYTKVDGNMVHPASDGKSYSDGETAPDGVTVYSDVYQLEYNTEVTDKDGNDAHSPAGRAIKNAMKYWLSEADIDGFRLDYVSSPTIPDAYWNSMVTDDLAHITSNFLKSINTVNSDPMIYLTNHDKNWNEPTKTLADIWGDNRYPMTVLEFTLPGMPLIYNGQEQNGTVALNYFNDDKIQWTSTSDMNMLGLIQELAHLKHTNNALNFTYTGESNDNEAGMFFVTDDSWNDATKHKMVASGSDDNYNYFRYEIKGTDVEALNNGKMPDASDPLYFKFQEFYDFLNLGTICKTDQMFAALSGDKSQFKDGGEKSFSVAKGNGDATAFSIVCSTNDVAKFIITFARSKAKPDEGTVTLEVVKNGDIQTGFYLVTPANINSQETSVRHKWRFEYDYEDPDAVSDSYMKNLNEDKRALCTYTIDASQFDSYIPEERKAGNAIQFRIRQYDRQDNQGGIIADNLNDISPSEEDADNENSTFDGSKGNKVYEKANWTTYDQNKDVYFKIPAQQDVAKYIIQCWQTGSGDDGATRVRVYFVKKYNYQGSTINDVAASKEDVYLYNVDAQKFLYVGNNWGTMASLLYDDLGTRLNISDGITDENPDYKLIKTRLDAVTTVPNGQKVIIIYNTHSMLL